MKRKASPVVKRRSSRDKLLVAQAQLRTYRQLARRPAPSGSLPGSLLPGPIQFEREGPAKFIQGWVVPRGYASVTQALDEDGQVWERVIQLSPKEPGKRQEIMDSWWEKLGMARK